MMANLEVRAGDVGKVWRGARGSTDMMSGTGALQISGDGFRIELTGTPAEIADLGERIAAALAADGW